MPRPFFLEVQWVISATSTLPAPITPHPPCDGRLPTMAGGSSPGGTLGGALTHQPVVSGPGKGPLWPAGRPGVARPGSCPGTGAPRPQDHPPRAPTRARPGAATPHPRDKAGRPEVALAPSEPPRGTRAAVTVASAHDLGRVAPHPQASSGSSVKWDETRQGKPPEEVRAGLPTPRAPGPRLRPLCTPARHPGSWLSSLIN